MDIFSKNCCNNSHHTKVDTFLQDWLLRLTSKLDFVEILIGAEERLYLALNGFEICFLYIIMLTKVKVSMSTWLRSRDSKVFLWRMTTIYNPASKVMWLYSISCSDWLTCELKLRLECILDLGVGTVKSFFGEWPLFIILHLESYICIPLPVYIGIHLN